MHTVNKHYVIEQSLISLDNPSGHVLEVQIIKGLLYFRFRLDGSFTDSLVVWYTIATQ